MKFDRKYNKLIYIAVILFGILSDRITKMLAVRNLKGTEGADVIRNLFRFVYLENRGAAFGMLQGKQVFFFIITFAVIAFIVYFLIKVPDERHYLPMGTVLSFVLSGAVGNLIDRLSHGYVVDFIYFLPIDFPVFNVADIYVTLGCICFGIMVLFVYKDRDFDFLDPGRKNEA